MRKLELVSLVTLVMLMLRRVVVLETVMVSLFEAGEFELLDMVICSMKNLKKRDGGLVKYIWL